MMHTVFDLSSHPAVRTLVAAGFVLADEAARADVVVTDATTDPAALAKTRTTGAAVVLIGAVGEADAILPPDCTPRELALACHLAARIAALRRELSAAAAAQSALRTAAETDPLTGLPNRRAWQQEVSRRLAAASAAAGVLSVAILDLDDFKQVNERLGFAAGDRALAAAAAALRGAVRQSDFVARLGGDEFGLLVSCAQAADVPRVVERVRAAIAAPRDDPPRAASAGCAVWDAAQATDADALLAQADAALRAAKRQGGGRTETA